MVSRLVHACPTAANGVPTTVSVARAIVMDNRVAVAVPDHERSPSQTQSALVGPGSALQPRVEPVRQADVPLRAVTLCRQFQPDTGAPERDYPDLGHTEVLRDCRRVCSEVLG